jgi:hypothetical protein
VLNFDRLAPTDSFRFELAYQVMEAIREEWNALDTEWRVGSDIEPILVQFTLRSMQMTCLSSSAS